MKKFLLIIFLSVLIVLPYTTAAQESTQLETLLDSLKTFSSSGRGKMWIIKNNFNTEEQQILFNHISNRKHANASIAVRGNESIIYALDIFLNYGDFGTIPLTGPYNITTISTQEYEIHADDFDDTETLYMADAQWNWLHSMNHTTGELTEIGEFIGLLPDHWVSGLSFDFTTNTMYALSIDGDESTQLYTLDIPTRILTKVGNGTGNPLGIWLEIDNNGNAYMADVVTNALYSVNLSTGTATVIGPLGIDIEWAQDVTIDPVDNTLYMAGNLLEESFVYTVNLITGEATLLGTSNVAEYGGFSIPGNPSLGIGENLISEMIMFPNPTDDFLNIQIPLTVEIKNVKLYDISGSDTDMEVVQGKMDVSELTPGVYVLKMETSNGVFTEKILIQ